MIEHTEYAAAVHAITVKTTSVPHTCTHKGKRDDGHGEGATRHIHHCQFTTLTDIDSGPSELSNKERLSVSILATTSTLCVYCVAQLLHRGHREAPIGT